MGTVGPAQFVTFVNGQLRSYTKAGVADGVLDVDPDVFFASVTTPVSPPVVFTFTSDPQIRYDRVTGRWILLIIDVPCTNATCSATLANRVMIAVSDAASNGTISASTVWTFFYFVGSAGSDFLDYPALGIDVNALYIGGNMFSSAGSFVGTNGYVVQKSSILGAGPIVTTAFANLAAGTGAGPYTPRGVDNFDVAATEGYFIGVDNATFSTLMLRRVSNPGSATPTVSGNISITVPTTTFPDRVEHLGNTGGANGRLDALDDRLYEAMMRNGRLWTAHNFRVTAAGVASTAAQSRNASRWYELQNLTTTPTVVQSGTVYDNAATRAAARQYFIPSIAVTGQGHAVIGFTAAGVIGATPAYTGRLSGDALGSMNGSPGTGVTTFGTSTANYNPPSDPGGWWAALGRLFVHERRSDRRHDRMDDPGVQPGVKQLRGPRRQVAGTAAGDADVLGFADRLQWPDRKRRDCGDFEWRVGLLRSGKQSPAAGAAVQPSVGNCHQCGRQQRDLQLTDPGDAEHHRGSGGSAKRHPDQS